MEAVPRGDARGETLQTSHHSQPGADKLPLSILRELAHRFQKNEASSYRGEHRKNREEQIRFRPSSPCKEDRQRPSEDADDTNCTTEPIVFTHTFLGLFTPLFHG